MFLIRLVRVNRLDESDERRERTELAEKHPAGRPRSCRRFSSRVRPTDARRAEE